MGFFFQQKNSGLDVTSLVLEKKMAFRNKVLRENVGQTKVFPPFLEWNVELLVNKEL